MSRTYSQQKVDALVAAAMILAASVASESWSDVASKGTCDLISEAILQINRKEAQASLDTLIAAERKRVAELQEQYSQQVGSLTYRVNSLEKDRDKEIAAAEAAMCQRAEKAAIAVVGKHLVYPHFHDDSKRKMERPPRGDCTPYVGLQIITAIQALTTPGQQSALAEHDRWVRIDEAQRNSHDEHCEDRATGCWCQKRRIHELQSQAK